MGSFNRSNTIFLRVEDVVRSLLFLTVQYYGTGTRRDVHLGAIYERGKLLDVILLSMFGGFLAGLMERAESLRHMGPNRNFIAAIKELFNKRSYECEYRYLAEENVGDPRKLDAQPCHAHCLQCDASSSQVHIPSSQGRWIEVKGEYDSTGILLVCSECRFSKYGVSPMCHVNNGYCDVLLNTTTPKLTFSRRMLNVILTKDHVKDTGVEVFRTSEVHVRILTQPPLITCDGELRYYSQFVLKMYRGCLPFYSRGREPLSTVDVPSLPNYFK